MTKAQFIPDRRKDQRYFMQDRTYAVLRRPIYKIGTILDISRSGMSFAYLSLDGEQIEPICGLDLLAEAEGIFVESISFTPVSDCVIPGKRPLQKITRRRQSVRFHDLDDYALRHLGLFITKYRLRYS